MRGCVLFGLCSALWSYSSLIQWLFFTGMIFLFGLFRFVKGGLIGSVGYKCILVLRCVVCWVWKICSLLTDGSGWVVSEFVEVVWRAS
jgi:hypothetical protein